MWSHEPPLPVDLVRTRDDALRFVTTTGRSYVTVGDAEPPMPWPWERRMRVSGAWIWIHPARTTRDISYLESLPPIDEAEVEAMMPPELRRWHLN